MKTLDRLDYANRVTDEKQLTRIMEAVKKGQSAAIDAMKQRELRNKQTDLRIFPF